MKPTIAQLIESYRAGTSVRSVVEASLAAIETDRALGDASLNAIVSMHERDATFAEADLAEARWEKIRADKRRGSSSTSQVSIARFTSEEDENRGAPEPRLLEGVPIILKDNICVRGELTTAGSKILDGYRPPYAATVTQKLRAAGGIILGKGNCDEFAMGSSGENSGYGPTKNPIDPTRVPGGSSSGPAVSVAAGWVPTSIGTDTGGSVRQPASFCGLVGLRPTYGRISRLGVIAMSSSLDQISPFTNSVADAATMLEVLAGPDPLDQTTIIWSDDLTGLTKSLVNRHLRDDTSEVSSIRIASFDGPPNLEGLDPAVKALISDKRAAFASSIQAAKLTSFESIVGEEAARDFLDLTLSTYYILMPAEVSSNLARYDGIRFGKRQPATGNRREIQTLLDQYLQSRSDGFGPEAKRRIMLGTHVLSSGYYDAYYKTALRARAYIQKKFDEVFAHADILMCPVAPTTAFKLGEKTDNPLEMYLADIYSIPSNIGGLCSISVPCGTVDDLPVGMQLIAQGGDERKLLHVAHAFEAMIRAES